MLKRAITPEAAQTRLEELCSRSEQCTHEVITKLSRWGINAADAKKILLRLRRDKYVDDARYARAYVRDKFLFSRWGRHKIALGLMAKRIPRDLIDRAFDEELTDDARYFQHLTTIIKSKARNMQLPIEFDDRQRLIRFGISRGYETALVVKAVKLINTTDDDDEDDDAMVD